VARPRQLACQRSQRRKPSLHLRMTRAAPEPLVKRDGRLTGQLFMQVRYFRNVASSATRRFGDPRHESTLGASRNLSDCSAGCSIFQSQFKRANCPVPTEQHRHSPRLSSLALRCAPAPQSKTEPSPGQLLSSISSERRSIKHAASVKYRHIADHP
jgi:hypothetical protein